MTTDNTTSQAQISSLRPAPPSQERRSRAMQVPENAREQIAALALFAKAPNTAPGSRAMMEAIALAAELALAHLDIQAAASEAVTDRLIEQAAEAMHDHAGRGVWMYETEDERAAFTRDARAACRVLAPALLLAGERRGLERAAELFDRRAGANAAEAEWSDPEGRRYDGFPNGSAKPLNHAATRYLEAVRDAALLRALGRPA